MAIHAPITGALTRAPSIILTARRRLAIESEIEAHLQRVELLIARLDRADAPFEDLEEDDHSGEHDGREPEERAVPRYALDQSRGPINVAEETRAFHVRELGLVPNGRGGWMRP